MNIRTYPRTSAPVDADHHFSKVFGLWLRAGLVGALLIVSGVAMLGNGDVLTVSALAMAIGGIGLAVLAWRRGAAALEQIDGDRKTLAGSASPAMRTVRTSKPVANLPKAILG